MCRGNRRFLRRAVRAMLDVGIRQFLDLGSGIPTAGNVHEIVLGRDPAGRIVYVDFDAVAVAHGQAILAGVPTAAYVRARPARPGRGAAGPGYKAARPGRPVGVLMVAVLHLIPDDQRPGDAVAAVREAVAPGSYFAVSHLTRDGQPPEAIATAQRLYDRTPTPMIARPAAELGRLLAGWDLIHPGIVHAPLWRAGRQRLHLGRAHPRPVPLRGRHQALSHPPRRPARHGRGETGRRRRPSPAPAAQPARGG